MNSSSNKVKKTRYILLFVIWQILFASCNNDDSIVPNIDEQPSRSVQEITESFFVASRSVGLIVGIIQDYDVTYYSYGESVKNSRQNVNEYTIFEIASLSKSFTSVLLMDLVINDKLDINSAVEKFLPDSVSIPKYQNVEITFKHLSSHTSALPRLASNWFAVPNFDELNPYRDYQVEHLYEFLNNYNLEWRPGTEFLYSNLGFGLLGHVIEIINNDDFENLIINKIGAPLEMSDTRITLTEEQKERFADSYDENRNRVPHWDFDVMAGAGALRSTANDLTIYLNAYLGKNGSQQTQIIFQNINNELTSFYRLGWAIEKNPQYNIVYHNGLTYGTNSYLGFIPDKNIGIVILANTALWQREDKEDAVKLASEIWDSLGFPF